jgi:hypothetical protein
MNETDFIRAQLAAERAHLREILAAVHSGTAAMADAPCVTQYLEWASQRLGQQIAAHQAALGASDHGGAAPALAQESAARRAQRLLALLEAGAEPLDTLACTTLRISHWRQAARLSADSILEERQLYAAARSAVGLA